MAKPTILQSLLGRPSQTYSFPEEKVYFSTKQDMVRIATETQGNSRGLYIEVSLVVCEYRDSRVALQTHDV